MNRIIVSVAGMLAMEVAVAGGAAVVSADFSGAAVPEGWVVENGEYRSPTYSGAVDRIVMQYSSDSKADEMSVIAFTKEGVSSQVATFTAASSASSFDFPESTDFRSFRLVSANGLALSSFTAHVASTSLDAPAAVAILNNVTGTSFDAYWSAVEGATGYKVYVWTNMVVGAALGSVVWQETFANAPATNSTVVFKDEFTDNGTSGWTYEKAYASISNGAVRVGTTSGKGVLVSPSLPAFDEEPLTLRITAWRQTTGDGVDMPVGVVSGDLTNIVGVVAIGDEAAAYHVSLPALNADDRIAIFSPTNKASARAIIDDVAIVAGYSEGHIEPSYIVIGDVGAATEYSFADLPSIAVQFAVEAYGRRGASSEKTEAVEVDLANPEKAAVLNACPLSSLDGNVYSQNFDSLATVGNEWLNGTTLRYWQAYRKDSPSTSITHNIGGANSGGLYALHQNTGLDVRALGGLSTQSDAMSWGMAFTNDTGVAIRLVSVSYAAQQWGTRNSVAHNLTLSCLVADGLNWMKDETDGWSECCSTAASADKPETPVTMNEEYVPAEGVTLNPGQVLYLKWTNVSPQSGSAAMFGIDDVTVTFGVVEKPQGFAIRLAHN